MTETIKSKQTERRDIQIGGKVKEKERKIDWKD